MQLAPSLAGGFWWNGQNGKSSSEDGDEGQGWGQPGTARGGRGGAAPTAV